MSRESGSTMTAAEVKADLDSDYRENVAKAAAAVFRGEDPTDAETVEDLYAEDLAPMSPTPRAHEIERLRRDTTIKLVAMRFGVDPEHVWEIIRLLEGMEP